MIVVPQVDVQNYEADVAELAEEIASMVINGIRAQSCQSSRPTVVFGERAFQFGIEDSIFDLQGRSPWSGQTRMFSVVPLPLDAISAARENSLPCKAMAMVLRHAADIPGGRTAGCKA